MKTARMVGAIAALFLILGIGLFTLAGWGAVVEYHAFEWRGVLSPRGRVLSHRQPLPLP